MFAYLKKITISRHKRLRFKLKVNVNFIYGKKFVLEKFAIPIRYLFYNLSLTVTLLTLSNLFILLFCIMQLWKMF